MNKDHLEVVGESCQDSAVRFEIDVSNRNGAVTEETEFPLHVQLLEENQAVVGSVHCESGGQKKGGF